VQLVDSSDTEDEEQGHRKEEVEALLPTPAPESPAEGQATSSKDVTTVTRAGNNTTMATKERSASSSLPPSNGTTASTAKPLASPPVGSAAAKTAGKVAVGSTLAHSARKKETGARQKVRQTVKPPGKAPVRKQLVPDQSQIHKNALLIVWILTGETGLPSRHRARSCSPTRTRTTQPTPTTPSKRILEKRASDGYRKKTPSMEPTLMKNIYHQFNP
jgi:hypothetical protein